MSQHGDGKLELKLSFTGFSFQPTHRNSNQNSIKKNEGSINLWEEQ